MQRLNLSDLPISVRDVVRFRSPLPFYPGCVGYAEVRIDNVATVYGVKIYRKDGDYSVLFPGESSGNQFTFSIGGIHISDRVLADRIRADVIAAFLQEEGK